MVFIEESYSLNIKDNQIKKKPIRRNTKSVKRRSTKEVTDFETGIPEAELINFKVEEGANPPQKLEKMKSMRSRTSLKNTQKRKRPKNECHLCNSKPPSWLLATCSIKTCKTQFCTGCIQASFDKVYFFDVYAIFTFFCLMSK